MLEKYAIIGHVKDSVRLVVLATSDDLDTLRRTHELIVTYRDGDSVKALQAVNKLRNYKINVPDVAENLGKIMLVQWTQVGQPT